MNGIKFVSAVIVAAALCVCTAKVNAMTVNWGTAGQAISYSDATTGLPYGDYIAIGIFKNNLSNSAITALWTDNPNAATDVMAQFTPFLSDVMGDDGSGGSRDPTVGSFGANNTIADATAFLSSNIFFVAFNNANPFAATEMFVGKGPSVNGASDMWVFPAADEATVSLQTDDIDGTLAGSAILIGTRSDTAYGDATANNGTAWFGDGSRELILANIASIPEPSTYLLVGMGLLGAWGLRRRRS